MSKLADALEALPVGHKLTRANVATLQHAAVELRTLRETFNLVNADRIDSCREALETKIRLQYLRQSMEAALVEARTW